MTTFIVLCVISGAILITVPFLIARKLRIKWKMPKGLFFRAGLSFLLVEIFYYTVITNLIPSWNNFETLPGIVRSLIIGVIAGLFYELGRFLCLDRFFKKVRSYKEGIYFGLSWNAVETIIFGIFLIFGILAMQMIINTPDLKAALPNAAPADIEQIGQIRDEMLSVVNDNPYLALTTILERAVLMLADIVLSLVMILGFFRGTTKYAWLAVLLRTIFWTSVLFASEINLIAGEAAFAVYGIIAVISIPKIKNLFPAHLSEANS
jgi:uncharacterized membrane protein YhfC